MSQDLYSALLRNGSNGPVYRRRKKFQGATWTPEKSSALGEDGLWCAGCRQRHGYNTRLVGAKYEQRSGVWHIIWYCTKVGNMLKDQPLVRRQPNV